MADSNGQEDPFRCRNPPRAVRRMTKNSPHGLKQMRLPTYEISGSLMQTIIKHPTTIIIGETGCGKTTQIPQYILAMGLNRDKGIVVTQPRRVATVSVAERVAEEMGVYIGDVVGYKIRFAHVASSATKLTFMTDGCLLREALTDPKLMRYRYIIVDEAHERSVCTDILFALLKNAQKFRNVEDGDNPLKVIIMSATMDPDRFSEYYDGALALFIEGRNHDVDKFYAEHDVEDYFTACLTLCVDLHRKLPADHHFLMFLTGEREIQDMAKAVKRVCNDPDCCGPPILVVTFYAALGIDRQREIFADVPTGTRKIILATNIAESSITIPGVRVIVDSGKVKAKFYNSITGLDVMRVSNVSQEQMLQRVGRAGRIDHGYYYAAYSQRQAYALPPMTIPEILRSNLASVFLLLLSMGVDATTFDFIDKPKEGTLVKALEELRDLGAIEGKGGEELKLTPLGERLSHLPLDPKYGKILLAGVEFGCAEEVLEIVSLACSDNLFMPDEGEEREEKPHSRFHSSQGDHFTLLRVSRDYNQYKGNKEEWCRENFLNRRALEFAKNVKCQLKQDLNLSNNSATSCGQNTEPVQRALISGLFANAAVLTKEGRLYRTLRGNQRVSIHPASALFRAKPYCVLFSELVDVGQAYMNGVTAVDYKLFERIVPEYVKKYNIRLAAPEMVTGH